MKISMRRKKNDETTESEIRRFERLLERSRPYGDLMSFRVNEILKFLSEILVLPIPLEHVELQSFFHPFLNFKVKDLLKFMGRKKLSKKDLSRYLGENLLSFSDAQQNDSAPLTVYTLGYRLPLIIECEKRLNYPIPRIKEIVAFDNLMIEGFQHLDMGKLDGKPVPMCPVLTGLPLVYLRKYFEWLLDVFELYQRKEGIFEGATAPLISKENEKEPGMTDMLQYIADFNYRTVTRKDRDFVNFTAVLAWVQNEMRKTSFIRLFQRMISKGYSPQVVLKERKRESSFTVEPKGDIDWKETVKFTKVARMLSFFRTPDLEVELSNGSIIIHIYNPRKVDSSAMRNIEKVYNIFRQRLNPPREPWGKKTGIRKEKEGGKYV